MNKRKIMTLALSICMIAILAVGGSLAYLTDTDNETNVFVTGNVAIDLYENFTQESKLLPVTYDENGNRKDDNVVQKEVFVTNTGSEEAYVRVHIAIPAILDNGRPDFDASKNVLHFNYDKENSIGADKWDWSDKTGAPYEGEWNFYEATIDGEAYNVYVVTYEGELAPKGNDGDTTESAMTQVYLDKKVTNADIAKIIEELGDEWKMYVIAEGAQVDGFDNAYEALNTAFGVPSATNNPYTGYAK